MDDYSDSEELYQPSLNGTLNSEEAKRKHARAQHNALERRRRDNIKDMYTSLKDSIPGLTNERASRAVVLKKAIDTIKEKTEEYNHKQKRIAELNKINQQLELKIRQKRVLASRKAAASAALVHTSQVSPMIIKASTSSVATPAAAMAVPRLSRPPSVISSTSATLSSLSADRKPSREEEAFVQQTLARQSMTALTPIVTMTSAAGRQNDSGPPALKRFRMMESQK